MTRLAGLLVASLVGVFALVLVAQPAAAEDLACDGIRLDSPVPASDRESQPLLEMDIATAHQLLARRGIQPGQGVVVAVIDSGVSGAADVDVTARVPLSGGGPEHFHGTAVASLIAGNPTADGRAVGIAPAATILDVQVYDRPSSETGGAGIATATVVAGLQNVLTRVRAGMNIKVVNISLALPDDERMQPLIDALWADDVVVVAPTGNRPGSEDDDAGILLEEFTDYHPGEDAAESVHPASYEHVLGVSATTAGWSDEDASAYVLENSRTDLAAPTGFGVVYAVNGGTCVLGDPATSWAAAEVSGVLAMNQSRFDESAGQATQRLLQTADGRADLPTTLTGAGQVQPVAALTRRLVMDEDGNVVRTEVSDEPQRVEAPTEESDLLAATRRNAVWWGLVGGGALLLALVLRPVLARRLRP